MAGNDSTHFKRLAEEAKVSYIAIKGYPRNMNTHTVIVEWKYVSIMLASKVGPCTTDSFYIIILSLSFPLHPFLSSSPPAWRLCYPSLTPHTWSSTRPPPHGEDVKCYQLYFHVEKNNKKIISNHRASSMSSADKSSSLKLLIQRNHVRRSEVCEVCFLEPSHLTSASGYIRTHTHTWVDTVRQRAGVLSAATPVRSINTVISPSLKPSQQFLTQS